MDVILHHYDISPYAEKIRLALGFKDIPWKSVHIPIVMPKPDLTELTGGYRRTPTLQVGADIYCDTKVIARQLERMKPEPSLYPPGTEAILPGLARWGETSFMMMVTVLMGTGGTFDEAFMEDRRKMAPDVDFDGAKVIVPAKILQLRANVELLDQQLADGRSFLLGDVLSLADLAAYHPLIGTMILPVTKALVDEMKHVPAWMQRVASVGHGKFEELDSADAVAIARDATAAEPTADPAPLPDGLQYGDPVVVLPEEVGSGPVSGELQPSDVHEIAIRRRGERAGDLVVHFPREDYLVLPVG